MTEQKATTFPKLEFLTQCLLTMLKDIVDRKPSSFYVTRQQIDQLLNDPTIEADTRYLVQLQRSLMDHGAAFISLPAGEKQHTYYVCSVSDPLFAKAVAIGDNQIKRVTKNRSMDIDAIRALSDYGLDGTELARTTCASIGHSTIAVRGKITGGHSDSCLRCGRKVKASTVAISKRQFVASKTLDVDLTKLTWRDTINIPQSKLEMFATALNVFQPDEKKHTDLIVDPDALAMLPLMPGDFSTEKTTLIKAPVRGPKVKVKDPVTKDAKAKNTKVKKDKPAGTKTKKDSVPVKEQKAKSSKAKPKKA